MVEGGGEEEKGEDTPLLEGGEAAAAAAADGDSPPPEDKVPSTATARFLERFSTSERNRALLRNKGVGPAAFLIRDAIMSDVENPARGAYDPYVNASQPTRNCISTVCRRICSYRPYLNFCHTVVWALVLLTFIEPPHWCRSSNPEDPNAPDCVDYMEAAGAPAGDTTSTADDADANKIVQYYPNSSLLWLTVDQARRFEIVCMTLFSMLILLRIGRDGMDVFRYLRPGVSQLNRLIQLVAIAAVIVGWATGNTEHHAYARIALLMTIHIDAQHDLLLLTKVMPQVLNILALLAVLMVFWAWFGTVMFLHTTEGATYFPNLVESLWTLWVCVTTAIYPDVMMPAYNENRWAALYFIIFMVISFFFLMNLILAVVVSAYDAAVEELHRKRFETSRENLQAAFSLLDSNNTGTIDQETVMALFLILNLDFPEFRTLSDDEAKLHFAVLDKDGSNTVNREEFLDFGAVMMLEFVRESQYATMVQTYLPGVYETQWFQSYCAFVRSTYFEIAVDIIIGMNAVVIGIQSYPELSGANVEIDPKSWDGSIDTVWEVAEAVFTALYGLEVLMKMTVFGWRKYFESAKNVFDFTITILAILSAIIVYYPNEISDSRLIRMIVLFRVLRLLRLLTTLEQFQLIGNVSVEILPEASSVLLVLFSLMYIFAAVGMHFYGGTITRDPANPLSQLVLNTDFSDNYYWANNFNDMLSAMNVLFNLLVVNNWTECEIGFEAVTGTRWPRLYFVSFHILGVIFVNNLVIAKIINEFLQQLEEAKRRKLNEAAEGREEDEIVGNGENSVRVRGRQAVFNAANVTGTRTSVTGAYIARLRHASSELLGSERREDERLRTLFTQSTHSSQGAKSSDGGSKNDQ